MERYREMSRTREKRERGVGKLALGIVNKVKVAT